MLFLMRVSHPMVWRLPGGLSPPSHPRPAGNATMRLLDRDPRIPYRLLRCSGLGRSCLRSRGGRSRTLMAATGKPPAARLDAPAGRKKGRAAAAATMHVSPHVSVFGNPSPFFFAHSPFWRHGAANPCPRRQALGQAGRGRGLSLQAALLCGSQARPPASNQLAFHDRRRAASAGDPAPPMGNCGLSSWASLTRDRTRALGALALIFAPPTAFGRRQGGGSGIAPSHCSAPELRPERPRHRGSTQDHSERLADSRGQARGTGGPGGPKVGPAAAGAEPRSFCGASPVANGRGPPPAASSRHTVAWFLHPRAWGRAR
jgi:hypothetical protein